MEKLNKSQMLKVLVIASLLIITPLLSTSDRSKYLYFILNILILLVGAEAGLLSFLLHNDKLIFSEFSSDDHNRNVQTNITVPSDHINKAVEERCSESEETIVNVDGVKPPILTPTPSIFFIGGVDEEDEEKEEGGEEEVEGEELFQKAETFIGNFYKQLKMQREESWNKLHHLYHTKAN